MIIDFIMVVLQNFISAIYRPLDQYLVSNFLAFVRGFEFAIFMTLAIIFLLVTVAIAIRQLRKLPRSYYIEVTDIVGSRTTVDGLREVFLTYEAAESYAQSYRSLYGRQYSFRVKGSREILNQAPPETNKLQKCESRSETSVLS